MKNAGCGDFFSPGFFPRKAGFAPTTALVLSHTIVRYAPRFLNCRLLIYFSHRCGEHPMALAAIYSFLADRFQASDYDGAFTVNMLKVSYQLHRGVGNLSLLGTL